MKKLILLIISICAFHSLRGQTALSAEVKEYNGRPTIMINSKPHLPMIYALTDVPGGRWSWEEVPRYNLKSFCLIGVQLMQVDIALDHVWREDGSLVMDTVQRQLQGILDVCPDAAIFIRLHVNAPKWWQRLHPEENTLYADTQPKPDIDWGIQRIIEDDEETPTRFSLASTRWKDEASVKTREFLEKLQTLEVGNAVVGIQVACGVYGEWHYWGFIENEPDMSKAMLSYFRNYLTQKYKSDRHLQTAWLTDNVTRSTATLPSLTERRETKMGTFRDPVSERKVIDYYHAQHRLVADDILHFCKLVKETWKRPVITGAFYGYFYAVFGREVTGGHLDLEYVLNSPYIDYLSGPGTYYPDAVEMGQPYRSRSLINSVMLHGKLWLDEMDQQPPLLPLKDKDYKLSLDKSIANVRRNIMFTASKGMGLWFYDFGPAAMNGGPRLLDHGAFGWWDEPTLRKDIAKVKNILEKEMAEPYRSDADVLVVHDTESFYDIGSDRKKNAVAHWANNWLPVAIFKSGVVHDVIHFDDLRNIDLNRYKAVVMVNTFTLDDARKNLINEKLQKNNRHIVWIYAPGYSDGKHINDTFVSQVTGIKLKRVSTSEKVVLNFSGINGLNGYQASMPQDIVDPIFTSVDTNATAYGTLSNGSSVGFVRKDGKTCTNWFMTVPANNPVLWRYIFKESGAHVYTDSGDIVYQGGNILSIHTKDGGTRSIELMNKKVIDLSLKPNSTTLINAKTGEVILD